MRTSLSSVLLFLLAGTSQAAAININFDNLADGANVGNSYAGVVFTNAEVQAEGDSLSPIFNPESSPNVAVNLPGGIMNIDFTTPITYFQAYFTYIEPLSLTFMDGAETLDTVESAYDCNDLFSIAFGSCTDGSMNVGPATNEVIQYAAEGASAITSVSISTASGLYDTFTIDNLSSVPEPSYWPLCAVGLIAAMIFKWKHGRRNQPVH
jgi:hypothetical protein